MQSVLELYVHLFEDVFELPRTLIRGVFDFHVYLFGVEPELYISLSECA